MFWDLYHIFRDLVRNSRDLFKYNRDLFIFIRDLFIYIYACMFWGLYHTFRDLLRNSRDLFKYIRDLFIYIRDLIVSVNCQVQDPPVNCRPVRLRKRGWQQTTPYTDPCKPKRAKSASHKFKPDEKVDAEVLADYVAFKEEPNGR